MKNLSLVGQKVLLKILCDTNEVGYGGARVLETFLGVVKVTQLSSTTSHL